MHIYIFNMAFIYVLYIFHFLKDTFNVKIWSVTTDTQFELDWQKTVYWRTNILTVFFGSVVTQAD